MRSEDALREGHLEEALAGLQSQVRNDPANAKHRVYLFQLLAVLGQWDRALNQLNVVGEMDAATLPMVQAYREAIRCEILRAKVFSGERTPMIFGEPERWIALVMEALRLSASGDYAHSQVLRAEAFEAAPATSGTLDGAAFEWIADADPRLGPILETVVNGRYYWVPFHRIKSIDVEQPEDLRDVVWTPANFTWANGGQTVGLIPTRYPGSEASTDDAVRLARKTAWSEHASEFFLGSGQRLLTTDVDEYPVMDVRKIDLNTEETAGLASAEPPPAGDG